jgi:lipopolysaccharide transport system ATP-binding protein
MKPIIEVDNIWKEYPVGISKRYESLRDTIVNITKTKKKDKFWALRNITFKVYQGESIGIIGGNGAGKSTLLKILSRITPPSIGKAILHGRINSLLEVGTGFHPELSGRENIFFNGSLLGMTNKEIKNKFEEIVDFAGVESFIDTPIKKYSSGMQMRLAFSVAAFLDCEIILLDEVLAVGDTAFQSKCIKRMSELNTNEGKTTILVSHDMGLISKICNKGILLNKGQIIFVDEINSTISHYSSIRDDIKINFPLKNNEIEVHDARLLNKNNLGINNFEIGESLSISISFTLFKIVNQFSIAMDIKNSLGELIAHISNEDGNYYLSKKDDYLGKKQNLKIETDPLVLIPGRYIIDLWFGSFHNFTIMKILNCFDFNVTTNINILRKSSIPNHSKIYLHTYWNDNSNK